MRASNAIGCVQMASAIPLFRPADLLLVSGKAPVSRLIKAGTCSRWDALRSVCGFPTWRCISHIGICANYAGQVLVFESTTLSPLPCVIRGGKRNGMQAHPPREWLESVEGHVWVASLPKYYMATEDESHELTDFLVEHIDSGYDPRGAIDAGLGWRRGCDLSTLFCSEIVAQALMVAEVIERDNASAITPAALIKEVVRRGIYTTPRQLK
jgi:hypothetical protein